MNRSGSENVEMREITSEDIETLYSFYYDDASESARRRFCPYPLFNHRAISLNEFSRSFQNWKGENDWVLVGAFRFEKILGLGMIKRMKFEPTSGLIVLDAFSNQGLGTLIIKRLIALARFNRLPFLSVTIEDDNLPSILIHTRCGFIAQDAFKTHIAYDSTGYFEIKSRRYLLNFI